MSLLDHPATVMSRWIGRREALLWLVACLLANLAVQSIDFGSMEGLAASLATQNFIVWFACYVLARRVWQSDPDRAAQPADLLFVAGAMALIFLTSLVPHRPPIGFVATAAGLFLLARSFGDRELKAAGAVLLALAGNLVWAPVLFHFLTPELLRADVALVGTLLTELRPDITWNGNLFQTPEGHSIVLVGACSSFHNVSSAILAYVAVAMLVRSYWFRRDIYVALLLCALMILLNVLRICLLAWSPALHGFWHEGMGVPILSLMQTATIALVAYWGARPRERSA